MSDCEYNEKCSSMGVAIPSDCEQYCGIFQGNENKKLQRDNVELKAMVNELREAVSFPVHAQTPTAGDYEIPAEYVDRIEETLNKVPEQSLHGHDVEVAERVRTNLYVKYRNREQGESTGWLIRNLPIEELLK